MSIGQWNIPTGQPRPSGELASVRPLAPAPDRDPVPASAAWRKGDDVGRRQFVEVGDMTLESGVVLPDVVVAYETWGELNADRSNTVLIEHALTADSHVVGPIQAGHISPGWWEGIVGPGRAIDTNKWFVIATNVLGGCQGTTGPASPAPDGSPWGAQFPQVTVRDQVQAEIAVADALGIQKWALVVGGSMGGMRALEWAVSEPQRVARLGVFAAPAQTTGDHIAWAAPQLAAIRMDPAWRGGQYYDAEPGHGPHHGLGIARRIAHTTYRSAHELDTRFGHQAQGDGETLVAGPTHERGRFAVESYLDHHADKLARRFDANSYIVLTESILSHDIGRGRGGVTAALKRVTAKTLVVGVDTDRLYPVAQQQRIASGISSAQPLEVIRSPYGHDGFLIESDQVGGLLRALLHEEA
ncbi:MAG TPA: homoserine O-acetyltransferase [Actinomycetales bacterium]|nr:homoserine O-acetyltransferase [Actinomycetales bacterium]